MAFISLTRQMASGYDVDIDDYIPHEVIGQAETTLVGAGYVVKIPDDPARDEAFYAERGYVMTEEANTNPREQVAGVVPLPYETHSAVDADPAAVENDENSEGKRILDPSSAAAGGMVGVDQDPVGPETIQGEESSAAADEEAAATSELADSNAQVDATDGAKSLANEEGVNLQDVEGTGSEGRVTKSDVEEYLAQD